MIIRNCQGESRRLLGIFSNKRLDCNWEFSGNISLLGDETVERILLECRQQVRGPDLLSTEDDGLSLARAGNYQKNSCRGRLGVQPWDVLGGLAAASI